VKISLNEKTGLRELVMLAVLTTIGKDVRTTKPTEAHPDGAKFHWCEVEVTYPNGDKKTVDSTLWAKSLEKLPEAFAPGKEISLTTQLEGDGAGFSKVGLPTMRRVDITAFDLENIEVADEVEADI